MYIELLYTQHILFGSTEIFAISSSRNTPPGVFGQRRSFGSPPRMGYVQKYRNRENSHAIFLSDSISFAKRKHQLYQSMGDLQDPKMEVG